MPALRLPNPLILLVGCTILAAALSYVLPAGQYERRDDPVTGRSVVVAGTYHQVAPHRVGAFEAAVGIPKGLIDAASVVFFVFLVGAAFVVVDKTGAFRDGIHWLVARLGSRGALAIPIVSLAFAAGGVFENMQEEIIGLVPVLIMLTQLLGFDALTAVAMSIGAASVGAAFSPTNPFQVLIAQKLAHLPPASAWQFRLTFLGIALAIWIYGTLRHARRTRHVVTRSDPESTGDSSGASGRTVAVLSLVLVAFAVYLYGATQLNWDFDKGAAVFFIMGVSAGLLGRLGIARTTDAFIEGFRSMTFAAMLIGFARAIYVVLDEGRIVDTIVHGLLAPVALLPVGLGAIAMMLVQVAIHVPVPSVSGQAVLTLPILLPLSDLLGLSRQVTVLAYQYGAGLCELVTPTNGALMAVLAAAGVRYEQWFGLVWRFLVVFLALGAVAIVTAVAMGLK